MSIKINVTILSTLVHLLVLSSSSTSEPESEVCSATQFSNNGTVLELDESNFDSAISCLGNILVDFYAPWCGHCKRLAPELDAAAPVLAGLNDPIQLAKVNADKLKDLGHKYDVHAYPTLILFMHGLPVEYEGPRKAKSLIQYLKKLVAPDVSVLDSDSSIRKFIESAGTDFPIYIDCGLNKSVISKSAVKYKKRAWFFVAQDLSQEVVNFFSLEKVSMGPLKVIGSERISGDDYESQISQFIEGYREGSVRYRKIGGPSTIDYMKSFIGSRVVYSIIIVIFVIVLIRTIFKEEPLTVGRRDPLARKED